MKKAKFVLTSDWHIRDDRPIWRIDDFQDTLWRKIRFIYSVAASNGNIPIIVAGDIGHSPYWSNELLGKSICFFRSMHNRFGVTTYMIPGQHDLPNHSRILFHKSGLGVISVTRIPKLEIFIDSINISNQKEKIFLFPYGCNPEEIKNPSKSVFIMHCLVTNDPSSPYGSQASALLNKYKARVVVTGDNHSGFVYTNTKGRLVVNPGSIMRSNIDQKEYKPRVYILYDDYSARTVYIPVVEGSKVFDQHLVKPERESPSDLKSFATLLLSESRCGGLDFRENVQKAVETVCLSRKTKQKLWRCLEDEK